MNKDTKLELSAYFKFLIVFAFLLTSMIPSSFTGGQDVNAESVTSMDGQNGCVTSSSDDSGGKDDDDSDGKKGKDDGDDGDSGGISSSQKKNLKTMYSVLHDEYGASGEMIAGIAGNWDAEGGLDPMATEGDTGNFSKANAKKATGDDSRGIGLGQWTFERHTQLVDYAKKEKTDWWEMDIQMKFMVSGDSSADTLKSIVKDSGDDVTKNAIEFHDKWEISADDSAMKQRRGESAKKFWKYMKSNDMDGKKDMKKIEKIGTKSSSNKTEGESSASATDDKKETNDCGMEGSDDDNGGGSGKTGGKMGDSVKANGKSGKVVGKNYSYSELPKKYKDKIQLPDFDDKYLDKPGNVFPPTNNKGECTELTWAYLSQLYSGEQPTNGDGYIIHKAYKEKGVKTTHNPTVGYGFSSSAPYAGASATPPGHTGVVVGVMDDGKWIMANYNVPPALAPSRKVLYSVVDGVPKDAGDELIFFEGVGKPKIDSKGKKDDKKDKK